MKHTPGPWVAWGHIVAARSDQTLIADLRRKPAASLLDSHIGNAHLSIEEVSANAYLLAAAPEMLEALEDAVSLFCYPDPINASHTYDDFMNHVEEWAQKAGAAIAKARGES